MPSHPAPHAPTLNPNEISAVEIGDPSGVEGNHLASVPRSFRVPHHSPVNSNGSPIMRHLLAGQILQLVAAGGGVELDAASFLAADILQIVAVGARSKARIEILNSHHLLHSNMLQIAAAGHGCVFFRN